MRYHSRKQFFEVYCVLFRKEKYARLKQGPPKHQFDDQEYLKQKEEILEKTDDAFEQGTCLFAFH